MRGFPRAARVVVVAAFGLVAAPGHAQAPQAQRGHTLHPTVAVERAHSGARVYRRTYESPVYTMDKIYRSMEGPMEQKLIQLLDGPRELLWIVRYQSIIVTPDGTQELSPQFMCHANFDTHPARYGAQFQTKLRNTGGRLATLSQGQLEIEMPRGFGIPWLSDEPLLVTTQVLNHNIVDELLVVRQRVHIDFVRDRDLQRPLKALVQNGVYGMALVEGDDGHFGLSSQAVSAEEHGPGCSMAASVSNDHLIRDPFGRKFSAHWVVEPGLQEYHSPVTKLLDLAYDTTVHVVAVHVHPFAESIELRDLTTGSTIVSLLAKQVGGKRIGLANVESVVSEKGIPLYKDHEYDLVTVYNNTTGVDQDSMAGMMLFLHAKDLDPRAALSREGAAAPPKRN